MTEIGDRIRLIEMPDDPGPLPEGMEGTVVMVIEWNGAQQIAVEWDNGQQHGLTVPPESFVVIRS
jgi:hypothetical protein